MCSRRSPASGTLVSRAPVESRTPVESSFLRDRVCNGEVREIMRVDVKIAMRYKVRRTEIISTIRGEKYASV